MITLNLRTTALTLLVLCLALILLLRSIRVLKVLIGAGAVLALGVRLIDMVLTAGDL